MVAGAHTTHLMSQYNVPPTLILNYEQSLEADGLTCEYKVYLKTLNSDEDMLK
jgi:hypothetical protein